MEFENREDLGGQQASKLVIPEHSMAIWWANKELHDEKVLSDYCGKNERTKLAVKIQKTGMSAPARYFQFLFSFFFAKRFFDNFFDFFYQVLTISLILFAIF